MTESFTREITHLDELNGIFREYDLITSSGEITNSSSKTCTRILSSYDLRRHFIIIMIMVKIIIKNRFMELPPSPADQSKIWVPYTIFFNIESKEKIKISDKKEVLKVVPIP